MNILLETSLGYKLCQVCDFLNKCYQTKPALKDFETEWRVLNGVLYGQVIDQEVCDRIVVCSFRFDNETTGSLRFSGISPKALSDSLSCICKSGGNVSINLKCVEGEKRGAMTVEKNQNNILICKTTLPFTIVDNDQVDISIGHVSDNIYKLSSSAFSNMCKQFKNLDCVKIKTTPNSVLFSTAITEYNVIKDLGAETTTSGDSVETTTKAGLLTPWRKLASNKWVELSLNSNNMYIICSEDLCKLEMCCRISA